MLEDCAKNYLQKSVATKPTILGMDAQNLAFLFYRSGIISTTSMCNMGKTTHVVAAVGYDTTGDMPYWLIKNSFGPDWGEDGYFKVEITNEWPGVCGVNYGAWAYPLTEAWPESTE